MSTTLPVRIYIYIYIYRAVSKVAADTQRNDCFTVLGHQGRVLPAQAWHSRKGVSIPGGAESG
jgi:hypothetical protein